METDKEKANLLNNIFVNKVKQLKERIDPKHRTDSLSKVRRTTSKFSFAEISIRDTIKTTSAMKTSKCCGMDCSNPHSTNKQFIG